MQWRSRNWLNLWNSSSPPNIAVIHVIAYSCPWTSLWSCFWWFSQYSSSPSSSLWSKLSGGTELKICLHMDCSCWDFLSYPPLSSQEGKSPSRHFLSKESSASPTIITIGSVECTIATGNEDPGHQILYVRFNHPQQIYSKHQMINIIAKVILSHRDPHIVLKRGSFSVIMSSYNQILILNIKPSTSLLFHS